TAGPVVPTGKNRSGSVSRQAASSRQSWRVVGDSSVIDATIPPRIVSSGAGGTRPLALPPTTSPRPAVPWTAPVEEDPPRSSPYEYMSDCHGEATRAHRAWQD